MFVTIALVDNSKLSTVPSKLLQQSLDDLELVENNKEFKINMGTWVSPAFGEERFCHVCHAGAMLVNRVGLKHKDIWSDGGLNPEETNISRQMHFINSIRLGRIVDALYHASWFIGCDDQAALCKRLREDLLEIPEEFKGRPEDFDHNIPVPDSVTDYQQPELYKDYIRNMICFLEAEGL